MDKDRGLGQEELDQENSRHLSGLVGIPPNDGITKEGQEVDEEAYVEKAGSLMSQLFEKMANILSPK